jgi:hypothetical protein
MQFHERIAQNLSESMPLAFSFSSPLCSGPLADLSEQFGSSAHCFQGLTGP